MFSIIIPSFNNLNYLKICINSLKNNSNLKNDIIVHINDGSDGSLEFVKHNNINFTFTKKNVGLCTAVNTAAKLATTEYILYSHDDMYFCPRWDLVLKDELNKIDTKLFYFSASMIEKDSGHIIFDCGSTYKDFDEQKLLENFKDLKCKDFQGSHWAPHLIHKEIWNKIGGFSEEFNPGIGSDPDLNMKLWNEGVRIYKGINNCKVYHFGSIVTRNYKDHPTIQTESGNKGAKIFILKWGMSIDFFKRFYLRSDTKYKGELDNPKISLIYLINLFLCKLNYFYIRFIYRKYNKIRLSKK